MDSNHEVTAETYRVEIPGAVNCVRLPNGQKHTQDKEEAIQTAIELYTKGVRAMVWAVRARMYVFRNW